MGSVLSAGYPACVPDYHWYHMSYWCVKALDIFEVGGWWTVLCCYIPWVGRN